MAQVDGEDASLIFLQKNHPPWEDRTITFRSLSRNKAGIREMLTSPKITTGTFVISLKNKEIFEDLSPKHCVMLVVYPFSLSRQKDCL